MNKQTRGRPSKVDLLPESIRSELHTLLRDKRYTQQEIRTAINELIDESGLSKDMKLSRTGLNRYASRMETVGAKIRQSREIAEVWTSKLGDAPESDAGKLVQEIVKTLAFDVGMSMTEQELTNEAQTQKFVKTLNQLALLSARIEQSSMLTLKREKEIRTAFAAEAATRAEKIAKQAGLSAETATAIKQQILGIV